MEENIFSEEELDAWIRDAQDDLMETLGQVVDTEGDLEHLKQRMNAERE